jgi:DNA-binding transcriptional LysR family regulator
VCWPLTNLRSASIVERIRRFELDAGILYPDRQDTADLLVTGLYQEHQVLIAGGELLTGKSDTISWSDALELPLCLLTGGMRGRRLIDDALNTLDLAVTPRLEADSVATLLAHVGTGRWASIVPQTWIPPLAYPTAPRCWPPRAGGTSPIAWSVPTTWRAWTSG